MILVLILVALAVFGLTRKAGQKTETEGLSREKELRVVEIKGLAETNLETQEIITLGKWTIEEIEELINEAQTIEKLAERIDLISEKFLGTSYNKNTLIGSLTEAEALVVNFEELDCYTYLDYVLALAQSESFEDFKNKITQIRYKDALVDYKSRRHFFTDWSLSQIARDITKDFSISQSTIKTLNQKANGELYLEGISIEKRRVDFIASQNISKVKNKIRTGDFIALYTSTPGLDVSHVGIAIQKADGLYLRNASSLPGIMKVIDQKLLEINELSPFSGIIIMRA